MSQEDTIKTGTSVQRQIALNAITKVKSLDELIEWIKEPDTWKPEDETVVIYERDRWQEKHRRLFKAIRENVLGRFVVFGEYTKEDYDDAWRDLNELMDILGF